MSKQKEAYKSSLGNNWIERNRKSLQDKKDDPVEALIDAVSAGSNFKRILEVGCANGWRMKRLKDKGFDVYGIDPSTVGIAEARKSIGGDDTKFFVGTADDLLWTDGYFDCVIMGFCMWAMPPEDWLPAVAESDRVLRDGGILIIHDRFSARPMRRPYPEAGIEGMYQYTYDWKKLWLGHPAYTDGAEALGVYPGSTSIEGAVLLQKNLFGRVLNGEN